MGQSITEFPAAFQSAVNQALAMCPGAYIVSGYRSMDEQRTLYNAYLSGHGNLAAPPGQSNHQDTNHGAVDIGGDKECMHRVAGSLGLGFPVDGEDWHMELIGSATAETTANIDSYVAQRENPLELANRMLYGDIVFDLSDPEAMRRSVTVDEGTDPTTTPQPAQPQATIPDGAVTPMPTILTTLAAAGFSGDNLVTAAAVVMAESGGNPSAPGPIIPPDGDLGQPLGWFQIREAFSQNGTGGWRDRAQLYNPSFNARAAFAISNGGTNWQPWEAYTNGAYTQYLDAARAALGQIGGVVAGPSSRQLPSLIDEDGTQGTDQDFTELVGLFGQPDISAFEQPLAPAAPTLDVANPDNPDDEQQLTSTEGII